MDKWSQAQLNVGWNYLSMLGLKLTDVSKRGYSSKILAKLLAATMIQWELMHHCDAINIDR